MTDSQTKTKPEEQHGHRKKLLCFLFLVYFFFLFFFGTFVTATYKLVETLTVVKTLVSL
jgi:hypothetical protein